MAVAYPQPIIFTLPYKVNINISLGDVAYIFLHSVVGDAGRVMQFGFQDIATTKMGLI